MKTLKQTLLLITISLTLSCSVEPEPINYGLDSCHFCKMTIVDKVHAAEIVTKKGKIYKFDAIECMINFRKEFEVNQIELYLCNHLGQAETLIDAREATFIISEKIPSPMGAFLSALPTEKEASDMLAEKGGEIFSWDKLLQEFND